MEKIKLIATAAFGIESIVADELKHLGYKDTKIDNGKIEFSAEMADICRTNMWLRCADRVMLKIAEFKAVTFDELYEKTKETNWGDILPINAEFPVSKITSVKSKLFSKSDCQSIIKKAIVDSMSKKYKISLFEEDGDKYEVRVQILNDIVTISIDTSGASLHRRGYRTLINDAPIKETLAAAMINLTRYRGRGILLDPMCGTGTIPIEAAMIARNIAPGSNRTFAAENWKMIDQKHWADVRDEAASVVKNDGSIEIYGSDVSHKSIEIARANVEAAGMTDYIKLSCKPFEDINPTEFEYGGRIITNPPYGERLNELKEVEELYRKMGKIFKSNFSKWDYNIITPYEGFESVFGANADKNRKLYNGGIKCYYYMYKNGL